MSSISVPPRVLEGLEVGMSLSPAREPAAPAPPIDLKPSGRTEEAPAGIPARRPGGFTLVECLIALALSLFVVCAALEFFAAAGRQFFRLKTSEERAQDAMAAMDKMRIDVIRSGQGLAQAIAAGVVEPVVVSGAGLATTRAERTWELSADVQAGAAVVHLLGGVSDIKPGRKILLAGGGKADLRVVSAAASGDVTVSPPFEGAYAAAEATFALLEEVLISWDAGTRTLRRKVNAGSAQPLLENAAFVVFENDSAAGLVRIRLSHNAQGENPYEICLLPKNPALAGST